MTEGIPDTGHAGDLVSAHLDGELDDDLSSWVETHLETCPACRDLAGAVGVARQFIRAAPTADAAPVVETAINRRRRLAGTALAFVGLSVFGFGLLALTSAVTHPRVVPDVDGLVAAHVSSGHSDIDGMRSVDAGGSRYATPDEVGTMDGGLIRRAVYDGPDLTTSVYEGAVDVVTVSEQPGRLDWDRLPSGSTGAIAGHRSWSRHADPVVVVAEVGDLVVTVIADDVVTAEDVIASFPAPRRSALVDRVHDSCQRLTEVFALGG